MRMVASTSKMFKNLIWRRGTQAFGNVRQRLYLQRKRSGCHRRGIDRVAYCSVFKIGRVGKTAGVAKNLVIP
jgi:hypothetical protein